MSAAPPRDLAADLTTRITALPGVRGIFPHSTIGSMVHAVRSRSGPASGTVHVDRNGSAVQVVARLATARGVPSPQLIDQVTGIVAAAIPDEPFVLRIEFALIE